MAKRALLIGINKYQIAGRGPQGLRQRCEGP